MICFITLIFRRMLLKVTFFIIAAFFSFSLNAQDQKTILFFGDSITAGYGLSEEEAFPAIIQQKIDSLNLNYNVVNSGLSGETTAGGLRRIDWVLQQHVDIFVLELGGNDGLRGIDPENSKQNLQGIIDKVSLTYPNAEILLTGMEAPPNMGQTYTSRFRDIYTELSNTNRVEFMPFILEGVAGNSDLNQPDGIHPTAEGHRRVAEDLWEYLQPMLSED